MTAYDKWLDEQSESRGLSLRMAFGGGEKAMLEKVREWADVCPWRDDGLVKFLD